MLQQNKLMRRAYVTETGSVVQAIVLVSQEYDFTADVFLGATLVELDNLEGELSVAIKRILKGSQLEEKDNVRDNDIRALYYTNVGYLHVRDIEVQEAAQYIDSRIAPYGLKIIDESYSQESAHIKSLLHDLATDEAQAAIAKLPALVPCISQLTESQSDFLAAYIGYESEKSDHENYNTATELKGKTLKVLNDKLVVYLRAMVIANVEVYGAFAAQVAQLINDANVIIKKRSNNNSTDVQ